MRSAWIVAFLVTAMCLAAPRVEAGRTVIHHGPRGTTVVHHNRARTTVVVHRNFPIRRALPRVWVRPVRTAFLVAEPRLYLAPLVYRPAVVVVPAPETFAWQDTSTFEKDDDWTDASLGVSERGRRLLFHVDGKLQVSFAEVVFENGDSQIVDFDDKELKTGSYPLLDFADGRMVSHVRMVARARSDAAEVTLYLVK